jgi:hypothetical protein
MALKMTARGNRYGVSRSEMKMLRADLQLNASFPDGEKVEVGKTNVADGFACSVAAHPHIKNSERRISHKIIDYVNC